MEDVTDIGFRMLCKRFGAAMVYTEFVSAEALVRSVKTTVNKLTVADEERPVGIQIYGRDVPQMVVNCLREQNDQQINMLTVKTNLPIARLSSMLFELEMKGVVRNMAGGTYHLMM